MHNPKQNPNELLNENAQEANYLREKKFNERNERLREEQTGLDKLNREIEDESRIRNSRKAQLRNEQYQEYTHYLKQKYEDNPNQKRNKNQLTEKIGGENRQIVRKNYEEMNNGLCLNPMREVIDRQNINSIQQTPTQKRNSSHGYNIINNQIANESSKYQTGASLQAQRNMPTSEFRGNDYQNNSSREMDYHPYEQPRLQRRMEEPNTGDYYQDQINKHNDDQLQPLKPVSYQEPPMQDYAQLQSQKEKEPELTEEDYKRYYDYLNSLRNNENGNSNVSIPANNNGNDYQLAREYQQQTYENNLPNRDKDLYSNYNQNNLPQSNSLNNQTNELTSQMHQLSLQEEARNEYLANKLKNRSSFHNLTDNNQQQIEQQKQLDKNNPNSLKQDKQRMYREYLDNQIKAKDVYKETLNTLSTYGSGTVDQPIQNNQQIQVSPQQLQTNPYKAMREKNSKFNDIPSNPCKNHIYYIIIRFQQKLQFRYFCPF